MSRRPYPYESKEWGHVVCSDTEKLFFGRLQKEGYKHVSLAAFKDGKTKTYTTETGEWPVGNVLYKPDAFLRSERGRPHVIEVKTESNTAISPLHKRKYEKFVELYIKNGKASRPPEVERLLEIFGGEPPRFHWVSYKNFKGTGKGWLTRF